MSSLEKIEQKVREKEALQNRLKKLEILKLSDYIDDEDLKIIDEEIASIQTKIGYTSIKKFDEIDVFLDHFDLDPNKVTNSNFKYLFPNFIVKEEITMWAAKPATGKSLLAVAIANMALASKSINRVMYFDADNGITTLKERHIDVIKTHYGKQFRYIHESQANKAQMWQIIKKLQITDLSETLVVFDSIKNFIVGDRDKNKDVSKIMDVLKSLRRQGATVLFLHHTNKPQKDIEELIYAGSSAWEEDAANAFILRKNDYRKAFIFNPIKQRVGQLHEIAFAYSAESHSINTIDVEWAKETELDEDIREQIINFIKNSSKKPIYSEILKRLIDLGYSNKDKVNAVIQAGKGRYWNATKYADQNFKDVYELIQQEGQNIQEKISQISHSSSDSYLSGGYKGKKFVSDNLEYYTKFEHV